MEVLNFLRDNGASEYTEADCYYLVKYFDSDEDEQLNYADFMQMLLPTDNSYLRAIVTQREPKHVGKDDYLPEDIEK
jgi:hypothetical protein